MAEKILIVEDSIINLDLLQDILYGSGYEIQAVRSAEEALLILNDSLPDLLLLDINLPGTDGFSFYEKFSKDSGKKNIPVIFISSFADISYQLRTYKLGAIDYITKPFNSEIILAKVKYLIELRKTQKYLEELNNRLIIKSDCLQRSENKYKAIFENMSDGFALHKIIMDSQKKPIDYVFIEINCTFETLIGCSKEQLINQSVLTVMPGIKKDRVDWISIYGEVALNNKTFSQDLYSDVLLKWFSIVAYSPEAGYFVTIVRDITKQKETEISILKSNKVLNNLNISLEEAKNTAVKNELHTKKIIELSPMPMVILDNNQNIEYLNKTFTSCFGYEKSDLQNSGLWRRTIYPDSAYRKTIQEKWLNAIQEAKDNDNSIEVQESELTIKSGAKRLCEFYMVPFDEFSLLIINDITEKKEYEKNVLNAIIKTEENERDRFSRDLHDGIGPMLSSIKIYFQWLAKTKEFDKQTMIIEKGNRIINDTIETIKEISNNISPRLLRTFGLISALETFVERTAVRSQIQVSLNSNLKKRLADNLEITLYQIIKELINNALKHSEATFVSVKIEAGNKNLLIQYLDNGKGFDVNKAIKQSSGSGIENIRYRIKTLGGDSEFESSSQGTSVILKIREPKWQETKK